MKQMKKLKKLLLILSLAFFIGSSGFTTISNITIKTGNTAPLKFYSMLPMEKDDGK